MRDIQMDELDQRLQRPHDPADGSWPALVSAFGGAVRGIAVAFNPFLAVGAFVVVLALGVVALSFVDQVPTLVRFIGALAAATAAGYVAGRFGNAIAIGAVLAAVAAAVAGATYGIWLALS